jgi:hypothetical protein
MQETQNFRTRAASDYLKSRGVSASPSYLEKCRTRGVDDKRDRGPDFSRDPNGLCWYSRLSLEVYAAQRLATRQFRAPAPQPKQLRGGRRAADEAA